MDFIKKLLKDKKTIDESVIPEVDDFSALDDFDKEMRIIEDREKRMALHTIIEKTDKKKNKKKGRKSRRKSRKAKRKAEEDNDEDYIIVDGSTTTDSSVWDSELKVISEFRVMLHPELIRICKSFQKKVKDDEFSILVKGVWDSEIGGIFIQPEYVVPKQSVGQASVDFDEPLEKYIEQGFNVVIHSHPFESSHFSQSDEETINTNFFCSVLFSIDSFRTATVSSMVAKDIKLKQTVVPEMAEYNIDDIKVDTTNINKKIVGQFSHATDSGWDYWKDKRRKEVERDSCYLNSGYNQGSNISF